MSDQPTIEIPEELRASLRAMTQQAIADTEQDEEESNFFNAEEPRQEDFPSITVTEQPAPKRRGRVPFKRNPDGSYVRDANGVPIKDFDARPTTSSKSPSVSNRGLSSNPISAVPLSRRDEKQVEKRLQNILQGASDIVAIGNPIFEMTDEEAAAIAEPLSSYLIRIEPSSKMAKQILDEYDLVAAGMGVAAYGVRVYRDIQKEHNARKPVVINHEPIEPRRPAVQNSSDDGRGSTGIEETAGETRTFSPGRTPIVPVI
jgi:hypothetical protein